jgi:hypothetical protein
MSAIGGKADITLTHRNVRFLIQPTWLYVTKSISTLLVETSAHNVGAVLRFDL